MNSKVQAQIPSIVKLTDCEENVLLINEWYILGMTEEIRP